MKQTKRARRRRRKMKKLAILAGFLLVCLLLIFLLGKGIRFIVHTIGSGKAKEAQVTTSVMTELKAEESEPVVLQSEVAQSTVPQPELTTEEKLTQIQTSELYPQELKNMVNRYEETIDFVYKYPQIKDQVWTGDLSAECQSEIVPLLLQWDERWGYAAYNGGMLCYSGCGPTCIAMAAVYLTKDPSVNPITVGAYAEREGFCKPGAGSNWSLIQTGCEQYGMKSEEVSMSEKRMKEKLDAGCPIIANVGPGDFTTGGHYLVIAGYDAEGFIINDPNSLINSQKRWTFERISGQIKNMWAMSKV